MAKHMVRNVSKVDYMHMTDDEIREVYRLGDLKSEYECTCFDMDGDEYVCYRDLDGNSDDRGYAVYLKSSGHLLCLLADAGNALEGYEDCEYGVKRSELYRQIALLAGWPEYVHEFKRALTWRELIDEMMTIPKEFLDTVAYVYRPDGGGMLAAVRAVSPWCVKYDGTIPGPDDECENCFFIDNSFKDEE